MPDGHCTCEIPSIVASIWDDGNAVRKERHDAEQAKNLAAMGELVLGLMSGYPECCVVQWVNDRYVWDGSSERGENLYPGTYRRRCRNYHMCYDCQERTDAEGHGKGAPET